MSLDVPIGAGALIHTLAKGCHMRSARRVLGSLSSYVHVFTGIGEGTQDATWRSTRLAVNIVDLARFRGCMRICCTCDSHSG